MPARSPSEDLGRSLWIGAVLPEQRAMSSHPRPEPPESGVTRPGMYR